MATAPSRVDIRRESLISAASNVVLVVVHLGTLGLLTRTLGAAGVGTYFFAVSASMVGIIPSRELSEIMRKRASEVHSPNAEFFGLAQLGTAAYVGVFWVGLLVASPVLRELTPLTNSTLVAFGLYAAALTQSAMSTRLFDAVGAPGASMVAQSVRDTTLFAGLLLLAPAGLLTPTTVLYLEAGIHVLMAAGIYVLVGLVPRWPSRESLRRSAAFGKWSFPTGITSHLWEQSPTMVVGVLIGGTAVGVYETAKRLTLVGSYLATCINDPLLVKVSAMDSTDAEVVRYVRLAVDYTPSVAIPAVFLAAPVATDILVLAAGPAYASAGLVLVAIALTHVFAGIKTPIAAAIHGVDEPKYVFYLSAATLVVGAPAVAAGALLGGINGVVLVLVALEVSGVLAAQVAARYAFGQYVVPKTLHLQVGAGAFAGAVVLTASHAVDVSSPSMLAAVLTGGACVHFGLFAITSQSFRHGSQRTFRDVFGTVREVTSR